MTVRKQPVIAEIRERLKKLREKEGGTQREMAERLGMTASGYSKYELGLNFLSIEAMQRMSQKLDVSMDWLLFNKGSMYNRDNVRGVKEMGVEVERLKGQLEAERKEREAGPGMELNPEERELFETMKRVPMLYHKIMFHFQEFKSANPSLIEPSSSAG